MPQATFSNPLDFAVANICSNLGPYSVGHIRRVLAVLRDEYGPRLPLSAGIQKLLPGVEVKEDLKSASIGYAWAVIDTTVREQQYARLPDPVKAPTAAELFTVLQ